MSFLKIITLFTIISFLIKPAWGAKFTPSYSYLSTYHSNNNVLFDLCEVHKKSERCKLVKQFATQKDFQRTLKTAHLILEHLEKKNNQARMIKSLMMSAVFLVPWAQVRLLLGPVMIESVTGRLEQPKNLSLDDQIDFLREYLKIGNLISIYSFNENLDNYNFPIDSVRLAHGLIGMEIAWAMTQVFEDFIKLLSKELEPLDTAIYTSSNESICLDENLNELTAGCSQLDDIYDFESLFFLKVNFDSFGLLDSVQIKRKYIYGLKEISASHFFTYVISYDSVSHFSSLDGVTDQKRIDKLLRAYLMFR